MASKAKRRVLKPHLVRPKHDSSDGRKEQLSLEMGSETYKDYMMAQKGMDEEDYVHDDGHVDAGEDKRADEDQVPVTEDEHLLRLAPELKEKSEETLKQGAKVGERKWRLQQGKARQFGTAKAEAEEIAAATPEKDDDKRVASVRSVDDIAQPVYDDGVSPDEFVPKAVRRMLGE